jgi:hypothetical protein
MDHCITRYQPSAADAGNPYLDEVLRLIGDIRSSGAADVELELLSHREELVAKYAFSIPTAGALAAIAAYSPLIEIGAGTGYWARCLSLAGADIIAFDSRVPGAHSPWEWSAANAWFDDTWFYVEEGDEATAALYPERSLFLAWPLPMIRWPCARSNSTAGPEAGRLSISAIPLHPAMPPFTGSCPLFAPSSRAGSGAGLSSKTDFLSTICKAPFNRTASPPWCR